MIQSVTQKHLGMFWDTKLEFQEYLKSIFSKINKTIGLLWKLHHILPRLPLLTIHKSFIRPHLDFCEVIYYQIYNTTFNQKLESIKYNATLAITGTIRRTYKEKLYNKLGLDTLEKRRLYRKPCCFLKIFRYQCPNYLFNIIPTSVSTYNTRNTNNIPIFKVKHNFFQTSFFPPAIIKWNKLDQNIRNSKRLNIFKKTLLKFIRPSASTVFNYHNPKRVKLLTTLILGFSHLREHKFSRFT